MYMYIRYRNGFLFSLLYYVWHVFCTIDVNLKEIWRIVSWHCVASMLKCQVEVICLKDSIVKIMISITFNRQKWNIT